ncbi:MAG: thiolase family protein, partial [Planctomycetota bacterium]
MAEAVIVGGIRTPFVKAGDRLKDSPAPDLGRWVVRECIDRFDLPVDVVDEVIAGNVASPVDAANVARVIALRAGVPRDRIAHTVCRNCGSGFESVTEAVDRIRAGLARCIIALGVDSMSNIPLFWKKSLTEKVWAAMRAKSVTAKLAAVARIRPSDLKPQIGLQLGLTDPVSGLIMGETAEKLAREFRISREAQDAFALRSHQRAVAAWESGRLAEETMTVYPEPDLEPLPRDIGPRENQSLEALAKLKPYF